MTTSSIKKIWQLLEKYEQEIGLLMSKSSLTVLLYIHRHNGIKKSELLNRLKKHFSDLDEIVNNLISSKFIEEKEGSLYITAAGKNIVNLIECLQYDLSDLPEDIIPGYKLMKPPLGKGSTSVTYKAKKGDKKGPTVVLKIFKPGIFGHIDFWEKLEQVSKLESISLVVPYHFGEFKWNGVNLRFLEMKYVEGITLNDFLKRDVNIDIIETLINFIKEVGGVLKLINDNGLIHGDLHSNNILVVEDRSNKNIYHFKVIDFIGVTSNEEFREYELTDFDYFKGNFLKIIERFASAPSGDIDIKKIGERLYYIYDNIKKNKYKTVEDVLEGLNEELPKRKEVKVEPPFTYLIFEQYELRDPLWLERFEPDPGIHQCFLRFGPLICSGPRGCGKTIYLRSLSFVPKLIKMAERDGPRLKEKIAFFKGIFGIYFACRQGEFKIFTKDIVDFTPKTQLFIKHIFTLKIIRKTLGLIDEAYSEKLFESEPKINDILDFILPFLKLSQGGVFLSLTAKERPFKELESILRNEERNSISILGNEDRYPPLGSLLDEKKLEDFFRTLKNAISELRDMKFYICFDDISEPQVSLEAQKILNCFIASHNPVYCCKFSIDKYAYTFEDMFGKMLQVPHDYSYIDLSGVGIEPEDKYTDEFYDEYFEKIVNRQLEMANFRNGIKEILEDPPSSSQELIDYLSKGDRTKVKFGGWNLILHLSSRSVREVLALCDAIFKQYVQETKDYELTKIKSGEKKIYINIQDNAIRKYSREAYQNIINLEHKGPEMFDVVRNFGEISRYYLTKIVEHQPGRKLFTIDLSIKDELTNRKIERIREIFKEQGYTLSQKADVVLIEKGKWKIDDSTNKESYLLIEETNAIEVYTYRKQEVITIERRDNKKLSEDAEDILRRLIRHSVFLDKGLSFSREQIGLIQKFTIHKKYVPALMTTWREREHLRLSKEQLEEFLLHPDKFREKLIKEKKEDESQLKLFDFTMGEENEGNKRV